MCYGLGGAEPLPGLPDVCCPGLAPFEVPEFVVAPELPDPVLFCDDFLNEVVLKVIPIAKCTEFRVTGLRVPKLAGIGDPE